MKRLNWCLGLLLVGILLLMSGCDSFIGRSWEDMQGQIDALEERVARLEEISIPSEIIE